MIEELEKHLLEDPDIVSILGIVRDLGLDDSWLCAGSLRNFVWNRYVFDPATDVDVVFFNPAISYAETLKIESHLRQAYPQYHWELKNQVYMHVHSPNTLPYQSACDAIEKFPEKCTAVGARLLGERQLEVFSPFGLEDIYQYLVRPTPYFQEDDQRMALYRERLLRKNWSDKWPQLRIESLR